MKGEIRYVCTMNEKGNNRTSETLRVSSEDRTASHPPSFLGPLSNPVLRAPTSTTSTSLCLPFLKHNMETQAENDLSLCLLTAYYILYLHSRSSFEGTLSVTRT